MHNLQEKQVGVFVRLKFDPTVKDQDAGVRAVDYLLPGMLVDYRLATGANRLVESDLAATTGGLSDDLSGLTDLKAVIIHNPASNAYAVTTTYRTSANSTTDNKVKLLPGQTVVLVDVTKSVALTHTAATATTTIKRWYVGY